MIQRTSTINVFADSDIVEARQAGRKIASELGFSASEQTLIATAISEIARNIVNYAKRGEVLVEAINSPSLGILIKATDRGPGIADVESAMRDGFSTGGGLGLGLPGARRLMDEFTIESQPGVGTTIIMKKFLK